MLAHFTSTLRRHRITRGCTHGLNEIASKRMCDAWQCCFVCAHTHIHQTRSCSCGSHTTYFACTCARAMLFESVPNNNDRADRVCVQWAPETGQSLRLDTTHLDWRAVRGNVHGSHCWWLRQRPPTARSVASVSGAREHARTGGGYDIKPTIRPLVPTLC